MAHTITVGDRPEILIIEAFDNLEVDDILLEEIDWSQGDPLYIFIDARRLSIALPDGFLDALKQGPIAHERLAHMALCLDSLILRNIAQMSVKLTRAQSKMSVHNTPEEALAHLATFFE